MKNNIYVVTKYHCKRSEPEKKSLVIKYFPSLSSSSLLLTDHFSLCHTSDFLVYPGLHFIFCFLTAAASRVEERVR